MGAQVIPLRRSLKSKLLARLECAWIRWLIWHAERDLAHHQREFEHVSKHLPKQIQVDRDHINSLTKQLARALRNV